MTRKKKTEHDRTVGDALREPLSRDRILVPLVEEELSVAKEWKKAGEAVLRKKVETTNESIPVELLYEELQVERIPVNRLLAEGEDASPRQEGDVLIVPVVEEELVVLKRRIVREELRVTKQTLVRQETVRDTVRKERIDVDTTGQLNVLDEQQSESL